MPDQEVISIPVKPSLPLDQEKLEAKPTQAKPVKTPDEVEDLPEHEAVEPEMINIEGVVEGSEEIEEKIILDQQEKETMEEKEVSEKVSKTHTEWYRINRKFDFYLIPLSGTFCRQRRRWQVRGKRTRCR